jgi:hypothetical protein
MAEGRPSLIDAVMPAQGMPLGGLGNEEIEVEEIQEPTDMLEQDDGSVLVSSTKTEKNPFVVRVASLIL